MLHVRIVLSRALFLLSVLILLQACQPGGDATNPEVVEQPALTAGPESVGTAAAQTPSDRWASFVDRYIEDFMVAHPAFAVTQGRHEFDGQLPDWSRTGIEAEIGRLHTARREALSFRDDELGPDGQYQREYLVAAIDRTLFWMEKAEWPYVNPFFYFDWAMDSLDPAPYVTLDYAPLETRLQSFTTYAGNIPRAAEQIRQNLRMPMARPRIEFGISSFEGLADYMSNDVPGIFAAVEIDELQAAFAEANAAAVSALRSLVDWLKANRGTATEDFALGEALFLQMIYDTERVEVTLEELEAMGRADMKRNQLALGEACAEFAPGESIRSCFARMANRKPPGGAVESARVQLEETRAFLVEQDLVTIPGEEVALVAEAPPYARSNSAYINIPGPYEENQPSVYYISPPDPSWPDEVQKDYIPGESDLLFTSVHEVWPGHFLNFVHAKRAAWIFGRLFVTYAFGEGWAHYTEQMMMDAGLRDSSPETRIGQLSNALLRNARFLSAIGLHTGGMTEEESRKLFMEEAYQDEGNARQQAARGTYDPAYLNYTMGKLLIGQLREDWTRDRGGRDAWREFHDTFLSYGGPPIPLVRARMMQDSAAEGPE
jgi:uncharacterized protein (DUF885 family)